LAKRVAQQAHRGSFLGHEPDATARLRVVVEAVLVLDDHAIAPHARDKVERRLGRVGFAVLGDFHAERIASGDVEVHNVITLLLFGFPVAQELDPGFISWALAFKADTDLGARDANDVAAGLLDLVAAAIGPGAAMLGQQHPRLDLVYHGPRHQTNLTGGAR